MLDLDLGLGEFVKSCADEVRRVVGAIRQHHEDKQIVNILDEMLRNPRYRFRNTTKLANAIGDTTPDQAITRHILVKMGADHNTKDDGKDTWQMKKYWEDTSGPPWKLKANCKPGNR
jgi:hypothetical protein